jgi:hypothetical protein
VRGKAEPAERPAALVEALLQAPLEVFPAVGLGEDYRFSSETFRGGALVPEGRLAHLAAFPARV